MTTAGELRSGKGHRDENFPVASWLIDARHRGIILAFYEFVRVADEGEAGMLTVETIGRVRREFHVKGKKIKATARELRVSRNTVRRIVRGDETAHRYTCTRPGLRHAARAAL